MRKLFLAFLFLCSVSVIAQTTPPPNPQRSSYVVIPHVGYQQYVPHAPITVCAYNAQLQCNSPIMIFSDEDLTVPIAYPFYADAAGYFDYYVLPGTYVEQQCVPASTCQTFLITLTGGSGGGGSGTVTNFSSGDLTPLFTTSVANPTTTPALSFSLSNSTNATFYANFSGSTGAPAFWSLLAGSGITLTADTVAKSLTVAASGGGGGGCSSGGIPTTNGLVDGDTSSTNCGLDNRAGDTATVPAYVQTFGNTNATNNSGRNVVAVGNQNAVNNTTTDDLVAIGDHNALKLLAGDVIAIGDSNLSAGGASNLEGQFLIGVGNGALTTTDFYGPMTANLSDFIAIGNGAGAMFHSSTAHDAIAIGGGAGSDWIGSTNNIIGIGAGGASDQLNSDNIVGVGNGSAAGRTPSGSPPTPTSTLSEIVGVGDSSASRLASGSTNVIGIGNGSAGQGADSSGDTQVYTDVIAIGHGSGPTPLTGSYTDTIAIGRAVRNTASFQTIIGDSSVTSLKIFGSGDGCLASISGVITGTGAPCVNLMAAGTYTDLTGTNLCGTVYQNTTGQAETVNITHQVAASSGATMTAFIGSTSTPVQVVGIWSAVAAGASSAANMGSIRVPNNWFYKVTRDDVAANCGIIHWTIVTP